ncbi:MAG: DNA repair protein RecO [Chlamydiae bacterium]|nr:DNA repair protein RecO [Chlamydiota bacterium]MBI3266411.1 DNA repair protein RecO [Chlamydiota bacterium]
MTPSVVRTSAILLKKHDYSDTSLIVTFLTRDFGKIQFIIKGAKKKGTAFEYGSCYEILFRYRQGHRGLTLLRESHLVNGFPALRKSVSLFYCSSYAIELLDAFTEIEDEDVVLFEMMMMFLTQLGISRDLEEVIRSFELRLLLHLGFLGETSFCQACKQSFRSKVFLEEKNGRLFCENCARNRSEVFPSEVFTTLEDLKKGRPVKWSENLKKEMKRLLWFYIDFHLEKPLKSRKFLTESNGRSVISIQLSADRKRVFY